MNLSEAAAIPDPRARAAALHAWQSRALDLLDGDYRIARAACVRDLRDIGAPWTDIAALFGVSERHLRNEAGRTT